MLIKFIGDVHGKFSRYKKIIANCENSFQVGDFGVGFKKRDMNGDIVGTSNPPFDAMSRGNHRFIRGNHDNPSACRNHKFWIPDGTMYEGIFCIGGAKSIDKDYRFEGEDWWADEELSYDEFYKIMDIYENVKPDIVCTHDCPAEVATRFMLAHNKYKAQNLSRTCQALQSVFEIHQPKHYIFGHWHHTMNFEFKGTQFHCLGELDHMDLEI